MKPLFLALALLLSSSIARADLVYKCKPVSGAEAKTADLRFNENGRGGSIEVDFWNGYPPISLVNADLGAPYQKNGQALFLSEIDPLWGYAAQLAVPTNFLSLDFFVAKIHLKKGKRLPSAAFNCNRF